MKDIFAIIGLVVAILALIAGALALSGWIFQLVWNWVIPGAFGWTTLTFWQSVGIVFLLGFIGKAVTGSSK